MSLLVETKGGILAASNMANDDHAEFTPPTKRCWDIKNPNNVDSRR
jgi:hypothetical protein